MQNKRMLAQFLAGKLTARFFIGDMTGGGTEVTTPDVDAYVLEQLQEWHHRQEELNAADFSRRARGTTFDPNDGPPEVPGDGARA